MLALGELLVEAPKDLDDGERGASDGIAKVTAGRRDGADDRHAALASRIARAHYFAGALVKRRQTRRQVRLRRRVTTAHTTPVAPRLASRLPDNRCLPASLPIDPRSLATPRPNATSNLPSSTHSSPTYDCYFSESSTISLCHSLPYHDSIRPT
jgi:hypothetical protein